MDCTNAIVGTPRDYVPSWNGLENVAEIILSSGSETNKNNFGSVTEFVTVGTVYSATPVLAALPFFVTGQGAIGLLAGARAEGYSNGLIVASNFIIQRTTARRSSLLWRMRWLHFLSSPNPPPAGVKRCGLRNIVIPEIPTWRCRARLP